VAQTTSASDVAGGQRLTGGIYYVFQGLFAFDTSALGASANISAADFSLYGNANNSVTDFTVQCRLKDWGATVDTGDWVAGADLGSQTLLATFGTAGWSTAAYNDFSDIAFPANVNKTGTTRVLICSGNQADNTAPTGDEYVSCHYGDQTGTTQDPKLVITYTTSVDVTVTSVAATAVAAGQVPTVSGDANVTGVAATASAAAEVPSAIVTDQNLASVTATATAQAEVPTIAFDMAIASIAATAVAEAQIPVVGIAVDVVSVAATAAAQAEVPSLLLDMNFDSVTATANAAAEAPTVAFDMNFDGATATATAQAEVPTVGIGVTVASVAATAVADAQAPVFFVPGIPGAGSAKVGGRLPAGSGRWSENPRAGSGKGGRHLPPGSGRATS